MSLIGHHAPAFDLPDPDDRMTHLGSLWQDRPVLLLVYKAACPTCQLAMPRVEAIHQAYGDRLAVVGISQDGADATRAFARHYGATFLQLLDGAPYPVSRAYGLTHVPTFFLIEPGGRVVRQVVAWDREAMNDLSATIAASLSLPAFVVSTPSDGLPVFKPG
jgi:peroxiredoxin